MQAGGLQVKTTPNLKPYIQLFYALSYHVFIVAYFYTSH